MANLKLDLLNKVSIDKMYEEMELVRLAQEPNMNYREKVETMIERLKNIAILNQQITLINQYFPEQSQQNQVQQPQQQYQTQQPHHGQTHAE